MPTRQFSLVCVLGQTQVPDQIGLLENFDRDKHYSIFELFACDDEKSVTELTQVVNIIKLFFFITYAVVK